MDIHKNARLSFRSREALVQHVVERAVTLKAAAAAFNVTAKTAAKWVRRYRVQGIAGLYDRSSRPHRSPRRLPDSVIEHVIHLRRHHTPGYEIARRTAVSPASISRILRRARLSRWRDLYPTTARRALRTCRPRRSAPSRHQGHDPLPASLLARRRTPSRPAQASRMRGPARRRRRPLPPGLHPDPARSEDRHHHRLLAAMPWTSSPATASACAPCSPTTAAATAPTSSAALASRSDSNTAALALTRHKPTARPNASSRPLCASGPTPLTGATPTNEITSPCLPGTTTTTATAHMVASTTSRPSAALNHVQRLEHLQPPRIRARVKWCATADELCALRD